MRRGWIGVGIPWAFVLVVGCGTAARPNGESVSNDPIASCERVSARVEACASKLGASAEASAERGATTREALHTQTEAAKTEAARAALDTQCMAALKQFDTVCP